LNQPTDFGEPQILQLIDRRRNQTMTRFKILGAAAVLSMMMATPLFG
jgi:hypothetical protein